MGDHQIGPPSDPDGSAKVAWRASGPSAGRMRLAEGARLVVPLEMGGYSRSLTLVRRGNVLHCEHWTYCGFVRDRGAAQTRTHSAKRSATSSAAGPKAWMKNSVMRSAGAGASLTFR